MNRVLNCIINLGSEKRPLRIVPGSHHVYSEILNKRPIKIYIEELELLIFDGFCAHGGAAHEFGLKENNRCLHF